MIEMAAWPPPPPPTSIFHCKIGDVGLNIPSLEETNPIMLRNRLDQVRKSPTRSDATVVVLQKIEPAHSWLKIEHEECWRCSKTF